MDREPVLPLAFAFALAVGVHLSAAAGLIALRDGEHAGARPWRPPDPPQREREPRIGDPEQRSLTANWISYEDYQALLARRSEVEQAAAQRVADAAPVERTPLDPTPPAPPETPAPAEAREAAEPAEQSEQSEQEPEPTEPRQAAEPPPAAVAEAEPTPEPTAPEATPELPPAIPPLALEPDESADPLLPPLAQADTPELTETELAEMIAALTRSADAPDVVARASPPAPLSPPDSPEPRDRDPAEPRAAAQPAPAPEAESNPTAAPRDEREAPPVSRRDSDRVRPGEVLTRHGIRIETVHPRWSPIALRTSAPANPIVEITFDPAGHVVEARIVKSSGYANVDGPLLTSLYRWRATGEPLEEVEEEFTMRIDIILTRR